VEFLSITESDSHTILTAIFQVKSG